MNLPDIKNIIKAVERIHLRETNFKLEDNRDTIANRAVYNLAVRNIIDTLKGIDNGNIHLTEDEE